MEKKSLAVLREEKGLTQEDVAKVLGITAAAYCRKEKGVRPLYAVEMQRLADLFGVTLNEISFFTPKLTDAVSKGSATSTM